MGNLSKFKATISDKRWQEYLDTVLGERKASLVNNLSTLIASDAKLQACTPSSLIFAGIKATALNLPLDKNLGYAYVIPYRNSAKNIDEAQFQMGYKGFIQLALRSGQFKTLHVRDVREGEIIGEDFVSGNFMFQKLPDDKRLSAPIVGFVAFFELLSGFQKMLYMTEAELRAHASAYSQTYRSEKQYVHDNSRWVTDFSVMASKTVIKLLLSRFAPMSIEMQTAMQIDQAVLRTKEESDGILVVDEPVIEYVDNQTPEVIEQPQPIAIAEQVNDQKSQMRKTVKQAELL